jgi:flagellar protein FliS|tara:strand:- start:698 stop:1078 length:381 start_codon:yes stop_codon:yes gene_type:complete
MNVAFARNEYKNTKTSSLGSKSDNFEAVSVALGQLLNSMQGLREANSIEQKDAFFEKSLTSIYFLQKCLDFEAGGELAKNLFRVYEFTRQAVLDFVLREKGSENMDKSIEYVTLIQEGWNGIEDSL